MSQSQRLSTLVGIGRSEDRVWPLNTALVAFGGTILWIVFRYLKPDDPRWLYNPWFYAFVTPVGLLLLSFVLSALVSRVVERSVQLAFLMSMIVHLVLLVFAVDIVIISRMWPDMFENIQRQRVTLKKQQEIPKYYNLAASSLGNRRPDYLRYVPTKTRPTETELQDSKQLQLARSEKTDLATPEPKHPSSAKPHVIEREQPTLTLPQSAQEAAPLSRSELAEQLKITKLIESLQPTAPSAPSPEPLQADDAAIERRQSSSKPNAALINNLLALEPLRNARPERAALARAELKLEPQPSSAEAQLGRSQKTPEPFLSRAIEATSTSETSQLSPSISTLKPHEQQSRTPSNRASTFLDAPKLADATTKPRASKADIERADASRFELPRVPSGDSETSIRTKSAGGQTGPAAALSMPVRGLQSMAAPTPSRNVAPNTLNDLANRKTAIQRSNSRMPSIGLAQSPDGSNATSLADGSRGAAAMSLPDRAVSGQSPKSDVAGLVGDDTPLARSAVGLAPARQTTGSPTAIVVADIDGVAGLILQSDERPVDESLKQLNPQSAELVRSSKTSQSALSGNSLQSLPSTDALRNTSPGVPSLARAPQQNVAPSVRGSNSQTGDVPRQRLHDVTGAGQSNPARQQGKIDDVPNSTTGNPSPSQSISPVDTQRGRRDSGPLAGQIVLTIDAQAGQGGVSPEPSSRGPLLARNDDTAVSLRVAELESTRFARREVGGPLASGLNVPVPKPAFQQRIDRLKDESRGNQARVGPQTEIAIERGLEFLARYQRADGSWRLQDFDTPVLIRSDTAAVGLSLLAFQGAGYTHRQFKHASVVEKALKFLVEHQLPSGDLYIPQDPASDQNAWLYSHSIATLALCEAFGMTQDELLREPAQKAVQFMVTSQDAQRGGWRYRPGSGTDTSVTGWFTMALKSAQLAGLEVPESTFARLKKFLDESQVSKDEPHLYRYNPFAPDTDEQRHGLQPTSVMTSVGLLMRLYFGWQRNQPEMIAGADHLLDNPPRAGTRSKTLRDTYYWYYATQVLFHMGGERWKKWHSHLHPILIEDQIVEGDMAGSWDPYFPTADLWARFGGRLYVTTMNLLSLEVNYRHLPLYEATAK